MYIQRQREVYQSSACIYNIEERGLSIAGMYIHVMQHCNHRLPILDIQLAITYSRGICMHNLEGPELRQNTWSPFCTFNSAHLILHI